MRTLRACISSAFAQTRMPTERLSPTANNEGAPGLSCGRNRPTGGSRYRDRSRCCGLLSGFRSFSKSRTLLRAECDVLPAPIAAQAFEPTRRDRWCHRLSSGVGAHMPPRWKRSIWKFFDHRLPSDTWYGSRRIFAGSDSFDRLTAFAMKKSTRERRGEAMSVGVANPWGGPRAWSPYRGAQLRIVHS